MVKKVQTSNRSAGPPWRRLALLVAAVLLTMIAAPAHAEGPGDEPVTLALPSPAGPPLAGRPEVVTPFAPPEKKWQAGHRGVDLAAPPGSTVLATAAGTVSYVGVIAGVPVVTIDHGTVRTTYQPVTSNLAVGTAVTLGAPVGVLRAGHRCEVAGAEVCLHVGLREGEHYLDPLLMFALDAEVGGGHDVRLLPGGSQARAEEAAANRRRQLATGPIGTAPGVPGQHGFLRPAAGPITSKFGMRLHPVTGIYKLHDGLDFGTGCGAPLIASHPGTVMDAYFNGGYGNRLIIDHGQVEGHSVRTAYNHAIGYRVGVGAKVTAGQVLGSSGSTGYSTGCHLHYMVWVDGKLIDPQSWL